MGSREDLRLCVCVSIKEIKPSALKIHEMIQTFTGLFVEYRAVFGGTCD